MIAEGRVTVNGLVIRTMGIRIDSDSDRVEVDGQIVRPDTKKYIMLHKPPGYLVSHEDSFERPTILDLLPLNLHSLFSVGRLDMDSEGLLLLTNDGELAHRLMHPRYKVTKEYIAEVKGHPDKKALERIHKGVVIDGRPAVPDDVRMLKKTKGTSVFQVKLHEGRKREIRRIFHAAEHPVKMLRRVRFDGIRLGSLKPGKWRRLRPDEIQKLKSSVIPESQRKS
jgi:pseudouridine synthase